MPETTDDRLLDDLRRYGTAVEDAAGRFGTPLTAYPGSPSPDVPEHVEPPSSGPRTRRRPLVLVAAAAVVALVLATVVLVRRDEASSPAVDTPPTVEPAPVAPGQTRGTLPASDDVPRAEPFTDGTVLLWLPYVGRPQYLGQKAERPVPLDVGEAGSAGCCNGIATINVMAGFIADGRLHTVDRTGEVVDTGVEGDQVVADRSYGAFYVARGRDLARYGVSMPAGVDGRWTIPEGWELPSHSSMSEVLDGRVILERSDRSRPDHEIAVWTPESGDLRSIGRARWVVDATMYPDGRPKVAWVGADCPVGDGGCLVTVTDLDTMENRVALAPSGGFIGGGAFSPDGRSLALFSSSKAQAAQVAIVDTATMAVRVLDGTAVSTGESFGSATWTLDDRSVIYHGLGETRVVDVETGAQRTLPWDVTYSMATIP